MKIRTKLLFTTGAFFISMLLITTDAMWTMSRISALKRTIDSGDQLIAESDGIRGLLRDMLFGMFSPQMYFLLEDLTYVPRTTATPEQWMISVNHFKADFDAFMHQPTVLSLLRDTEMRDKYTAAMTISKKAFLKIDALNSNLQRFQSANILGNDDTYKVIQSSDDDQVASFFDEVRTTSYYLTDNFESFLDYFLKSLARESELIQRRMIMTFIAVTAVAGLFTISVSLYFARRITESIKGVERTIRQVSLGDFSTHVNLASNDEFGTLSAKLNSFIDDLKSNVDSIINLMRDVGTGTGERLGLDGIFALVVESVVKDMRIGGAAIFLSEELGAVMRLRASAGAFPLSAQAAATSTVSSSDAVFGAAFRSGLPVFLRDVEANTESCGTVVDASQARSVIAIPLVVSKRVIGVLAAATVRSDRQLNDLDRTNLSTFADYTALTIDNFTQYTELIERREAEYQALQSQVHPHFLYNVLAGFVGLNRLGDRKTLERSILALKEMLRYTIEHQEWTTVEEEFQFIRRYCDLQKLRFRERLDFTLSYDDDAAPCHIPKLLLQPLVENAVIHGIEPLDRTGHLQVHAGLRFSDLGRILCLTVSDDGVGFEPGPIGKQAHIGLYNVKERVALAFEQGSFRIASRPGEGTQIEILTSAMEP